jgi:cobaltochelatase CobS
MSTATEKSKPESKIIGQAKVRQLLEMAADNTFPALVVGETGVGKTSIIQDIANVRGQAWTRFNLTGDTTADEFVGKYTLKGGNTVWEDGILLQAMAAGNWLIVDEINVALPEILFVLHSLLDDDRFVVVAGHQGEVVRPHKNFRFFATMNPVEEYAGTKELNKAFQSRFPVVIEMTYPPKAEEIKIVAAHTGLNKLETAKLVDVAKLIRAAKAENKVFYTCSTRDLIHWGKVTLLSDIETGFTVAVLNKAPGDKTGLIALYDKVVGAYTKLAVGLEGEELTVEYFQRKVEEINTHEATFDERVRQEVQSRVQKALA